MLQRTLRPQLELAGQPLCSTCDVTWTQDRERQHSRITSASIIKEAKEDAGYVCFEKYNKAQVFYFNELQCLYLGI